MSKSALVVAIIILVKIVNYKIDISIIIKVTEMPVITPIR